jgi:hypothetical protein
VALEFRQGNQRTTEDLADGQAGECINPVWSEMSEDKMIASHTMRLLEVVLDAYRRYQQAMRRTTKTAVDEARRALDRA